MLGTKIKKDLFSCINQMVIIQDPEYGPLEVEVKDITNGMVYYEVVTGELGSISVEEFEERLQGPK